MGGGGQTRDDTKLDETPGLKSSEVPSDSRADRDSVGVAVSTQGPPRDLAKPGPSFRSHGSLLSLAVAAARALVVELFDVRELGPLP